MTKILLLNYKFDNTINQPNNDAVYKNYGIFPPLSLLYVAGNIKAAGHVCTLIDADAEQLSFDDVIRKIENEKPDLIGFSINTYFFHETVDLIREIKKIFSVPMFVGGMHTSLYPKETLLHKEIDYVMIGEAENNMKLFLDGFEKGDISQVPGLGFRKDNAVVINRPLPKLKSIDNLPFPARELIDNTKYYSLISMRKNFTGLITSRGCPYGCLYCEQSTSDYRFRSPEDIMKEVYECYHNYGIREFEIFDSSFTVNRKNVVKVCNAFIESGLDFVWAVRTRVDCVDADLLRLMRKAGCRRIYYGIESGDPYVLKNLRKMTDIDSIEKTIKATKKAKISTFGYFLIGSPYDTPQTITKTIKWAKKLKLDYAQFNKLSTLPGTPLYKLLLPELPFDYWKEFIKNRSVKQQLPRYKCLLSEEKLDAYVDKGYSSFYFRPSQIIKKIMAINSFDEFSRYAKAGKDLMLDIIKRRI